MVSGSIRTWSVTSSHGNNLGHNSFYGWPKVVRRGLGVTSIGFPVPDLLSEQPYPTTLIHPILARHRVLRGKNGESASCGHSACGFAPARGPGVAIRGCAMPLLVARKWPITHWPGSLESTPFNPCRSALRSLISSAPTGPTLCEKLAAELQGGSPFRRCALLVRVLPFVITKILSPLRPLSLYLISGSLFLTSRLSRRWVMSHVTSGKSA